jgi:ribosome maturation factor RimP
MRYRSVDRLSSDDIGQRVTVRRRLPEGGSTDVLGVLEALTDSKLTVRDKHGDLVEVERAAIVASRVIRKPN